MQAPDAATRVRFGPFCLDSARRDLRRHGSRIRLSEQPFQVLIALLEAQGEVVTRETLYARLWPHNKYGDVDHGLNVAVKKLRDALGDFAAEPRYIATLDRQGYRFIGQVERMETPGPACSPASAMSATAEGTRPVGSSPAVEAIRPVVEQSGTFVRNRRVPVALVWFSLFGAAVVVSSLFFFSLRSKTRTAVSFTLAPPEETTFTEFDSIAISPDGRFLAFTATDLTRARHLWVRALDNPRSRMLEETEDALFPFWSPDSRSIGFFIPGKLKRVDISGGPPQELCDAPDGRGGTWNRSGVILFAPAPDSPLFRTSPTGGMPKPVTTLDNSHQEITQRWPVFLPDGNRFLYMARSSVQQNTGIYLASLSSPRGTLLSHVQSRAEISRNRVGEAYLVFANGPSLLAQPFDTGRGALVGNPFLVADPIGHSEYIEPLHAAFATSEEGVLAYVSGRPLDQLTWFERDGARSGTVGEPGVHLGASLSPDGKTVAFTLRDPRVGKFGIWREELNGGRRSQLTFDRIDHTLPVWSPDGSRIAYGANVRGVFNMYERPSTGAGTETLIQKSDRFQIPTDWSPDGRVLLYF